MNHYPIWTAIGLLCLSLNAQAGCVGIIANGGCIGTDIDHPQVGSGSSSRSGYEGSSGTRYQYDLGQPTERLRYSTDLDAQRRDQMSLEPGRSLDRSLGQQGGGILGD